MPIFPTFRLPSILNSSEQYLLFIHLLIYLFVCLFICLSIRFIFPISFVSYFAENCIDGVTLTEQSRRILVHGQLGKTEIFRRT